MEKVLVSEEMAIKLGQYMAGAEGKKALSILNEIFGSRLSYTRGEPDHTNFLEGQRSVVQFIENAVKAAKAEDK